MPLLSLCPEWERENVNRCCYILYSFLITAVFECLNICAVFFFIENMLSNDSIWFKSEMQFLRWIHSNTKFDHIQWKTCTICSFCIFRWRMCMFAWVDFCFATLFWQTTESNSNNEVECKLNRRKCDVEYWICVNLPWWLWCDLEIVRCICSRAFCPFRCLFSSYSGWVLIELSSLDKMYQRPKCNTAVCFFFLRCCQIDCYNFICFAYPFYFFSTWQLLMIFLSIRFSFLFFSILFSKQITFDAFLLYRFSYFLLLILLSLLLQERKDAKKVLKNENDSIKFGVFFFSPWWNSIATVLKEMNKMKLIWCTSYAMCLANFFGCTFFF